MINKYCIKKINNNDVLVLYLDYDYEFSSMDNGTFFKNIHDYIKNIKFKGNKIILIVGSVVIGSIILNSNLDYNKDNKEEKQINYVSEITLNNYTSKNKLKSTTKINVKTKNVKTIAVKNVKKGSNNKKTTNKSLINKNIKSGKVTNKKKKNINNSNSKKQINTKAKKKNVTAKKTSNKKAKKSTPTKKNTTNKKKENNDIIVTVYRTNGNVIKLNLEEYLIGVVGGEMPASFHSEALKAQAIAARTYTLKAIKNNKKLTDNVSTQVYKDNNELKKIWGNSYNNYYNKIKNAVNSTQGMYITYDGQYIDALFHSTSNGYTEDASNVWKNSIPYLKSVKSLWDKNVNSYSKTIYLSYSDFSKIIGIDINNNSTISLIRNKSNRVSNIKIESKSFTGIEFRNLLSLRSTDFSINLKEKVEITTRGYGHGVGLSQYGANEMAKVGYTYDQIIKHYYTGVVISKAM